MREYPKRPNPKTGKNFKRGDWNIAKNKRFLFYEVSKIGRDKKHAGSCIAHGFCAKRKFTVSLPSKSDLLKKIGLQFTKISKSKLGKPVNLTFQIFSLFLKKWF